MMCTNRNSLLWAGILALLATLVTLPLSARELPSGRTQITFVSPDEAVQSLVAAVRDDDIAKLTAIFGPEAQELISSGDEVADRNGRHRFLNVYAENHYLEKQGDIQAVLHIGTNEYPFPIPLVKQDKGWHFDTRAGKEEILNRRIGRNELRTIEVLYAFTAAQRDYACLPRQDNDVPQFAQQLISSTGKHNGLYWPTNEGEVESPLGPLVARASEAGYDGNPAVGEAEPFHGYYFKILTGQGPSAKGGAFDYLVKGKMVLGFGMVAYPARYGSSGVKTFIVNQEGVIYEKDLGEFPEEAAAMNIYDPDQTWQRYEEPQE